MSLSDDFEHSQINQSNGNCAPKDPCCYVLIRFNMSRFQSCVNSLVTQMSVSSSYTGRVVGVAKKVDTLEGYSWPRDKGMALLQFSCVCEAERWIQCTPDVKQQDWLGGDVDIVAVSVRSLPANQKLWIQVIDFIQIDELNRFCTQYVDKVNPYLNKQDGAHVSAGVVAASGCGRNPPKSLRGRWTPHTLIVNQFDSREAFDSAYNSAEYQPLKQTRQQMSQANVVIFEMIPLIHKKC